MTLNEYSKRAHETAISKGWHDKPRSVLEELALIHSEVSEAVEEARISNVYDAYFIDKETGARLYYKDNDFPANEKPLGFEIELADVLIRVFDLAGKLGIDLDFWTNYKMNYNESREYRHGNKLF